MQYLMLISILLNTIFQNPASLQGSGLAVLDFKWSKDRQVAEILKEPEIGPARAVIAANKNFERNRRINDSPGARDPNLDTIDGRSAALEKAVQESRSAQPKAIDGFAYKTKLKNTTENPIDIVFWEYQFIDPADHRAISRRQFLCGVNIAPGKQKEVRAFSISGPTDVVDVTMLEKPLRENVVINRVEYTDGSIWQRKDWDFSEIRLTYRRAIASPWGKEMCRSL